MGRNLATLETGMSFFLLCFLFFISVSVCHCITREDCSDIVIVTAVKAFVRKESEERKGSQLDALGGGMRLL